MLLILQYSAPKSVNSFTVTSLPACLLNSDKKGLKEKKTIRMGEEVKDNTRSKSIFTFKLPKQPVIFLCSTHANNANHRSLVML